MRKQWLSGLLAGVMVLTLLPAGGLGAAAAQGGDFAHAHDTGWLAWSGEGGGPTESGNYYLTGDTRLNQTWTPADGTVLCLNGHVLKYGGSGRAIQVAAGRTFALEDETGDGALKGGGVQVEGTFQMTGGAIRDGVATKGGGVLVGSAGTFQMEGGEVISNRAEEGGGIYVEDHATLRLLGGMIRSNRATGRSGRGGGVFCSGTVQVIDAFVVGNSAKQGGGVYVNSDGFSLAGKAGNQIEIEDNASNYQANDIYLPLHRVITLEEPAAFEGTVGIRMEEPGIFARGECLSPEDGTHFSSDDENYWVSVDGDQMMLTDQSVWTYSAAGDTITAVGQPGDVDGGKVVLHAPQEPIRYNGEEWPAWVESTLVTEAVLPEIVYQKRVEGSDVWEPQATVPVDAGEYCAGITLEGASVQVNYAIQKAEQDIEVPAPDLKEIHETQVSVVPVTVIGGGGAVEYAISTTNTPPEDGWQQETLFTGLDPETDYYCFARDPGDENHQPVFSEGTAVTTLVGMQAVEGHVTSPIGGTITVVLKDAAGVLRTTEANATGSYHFEGVADGQCTLTFSCPGCQTAERTVMVERELVQVPMVTLVALTPTPTPTPTVTPEPTVCPVPTWTPVPSPSHRPDPSPEPSKCPDPWKCDGGKYCPSRAFCDLDPKAWYHEAVDFVLCHELMDGVGNRRFDPDGPLTRGMFVTMLYRDAGSPNVGCPPVFRDVKAGQWYSKGVGWAASRGIAIGYGNGNFGPEDEITREQVALILYRYAQCRKGEALTDYAMPAFADRAEVSPWAMKAVAWCAGTKILRGYDGKLLPGEGASRAQGAAILMRFYRLTRG